MHYCFGARLVGTTLAATLKEVFKLKNVKRGNGRAGSFARVEEEFAGVRFSKYLDANSAESPIPTSLTIEYDA